MATVQAIAAVAAQNTKIQVKNLNFFYNRYHALKNINLAIPDRKVTAFIGPSGCGKSTLLRTMNRMYDLYPRQRAEGEILFNGQNILTPKQDVNLLRATSAAFGAAIGGAEGILLIPFNTRHGTPDAFARRLARNTQLVLQEEAQLGRVADAAGGSWYVEDLTNRLAARAWEEFRRVEAAGGLVAALEQGLVYRALVDARHRALLVVGPGVDVQHVLHVGHERRAAIRGDDPLLLQPRLEVVF